MNLAVVGHDLVLDVESASRRKGARAILWPAKGTANQVREDWHWEAHDPI